MKLKRFKAQGFRNIESCDIEFSDGVNLLYGDNAEGKTNAIEGIYVFSRGKSFRAKEDSELIKFGEDGFNLYIEYEDSIGKNTLEYSLYKKERRRKKNGYRIDKVKDMIGSFKSVLFYPDDLLLVKGGPEERRDFLNVAIGQCYNSYIGYYASYKKALENRNCLLKFASKGMYFDERELISWSEYMAEHASFIYLMRLEYIKRLEKYSSKIMKEISEGKEDMTLSYKSDIEEEISEREEIKKEYIKILTENIDKEKIVGVSLYGPHRDDLVININGKSARSYSSQGQQRSIVLSLKLGEGEVSREICGEYPVFLFDDVLSELDDGRKNYILSGTEDRQVIITSCENNDDIKVFKNKIKVNSGRYSNNQ